MYMHMHSYLLGRSKSYIVLTIQICIVSRYQLVHNESGPPFSSHHHCCHTILHGYTHVLYISFPLQTLSDCA